MGGQRHRRRIWIAALLAVGLGVWVGIEFLWPVYTRARIENALRTGDAAVVKRLVTKDVLGSWPDERSGLLQMAAVGGNIEVVDALVNMGADVNRPDADGDLPLGIAAWHGHTGTVRRLLSAGALPDKQEPSGGSALILAAGRGHIGSVEALIAAGANLETRNSLGSTALQYATLGGHRQVVEMLLDHGADINSQAENGCTAAHSAIWTRDIPILALLIGRGADLSRRDQHGRSVYDYAEDLRLTEFQALLAAASQPAGATGSSSTLPGGAASRQGGWE